jgi:hypothetical protein
MLLRLSLGLIPCSPTASAMPGTGFRLTLLGEAGLEGDCGSGASGLGGEVVWSNEPSRTLDSEDRMTTVA